MHRIRIALFNNRGDAEAVRDRLTQAGIVAECHNELRLARLWFVSKRLAGIRLEVAARYRERATQLLCEWDSLHGAMGAAIRCPECKSFRVDYPQFTQKSLLTNLAMGLLAEFKLVERDYYCEVCHCMWPKPGARPRRNRSHSAPDYFLENIRIESSPKAHTAGSEPGVPLAQTSSKAPRGQSHSTAPSIERFHGLKPWRKPLGIAIPLGGIMLLVHSVVAGENVGGGKVPIRTGSHPAETKTPTYLRDVLPIFMGKCSSCHNDQATFLHNWFDYKTALADRWEIKRRVWDSWKGNYFKQPMPIGNSPESEAMTEEEHMIIKDWVDAGAPYGVRPADDKPKSKAERVEHGRQLFATVCAVCHQPSGQGIPNRFPPLVGSDFLNSDKGRAIRIVLNGIQGEIFVNGQKFDNTMPSLPMADEDIAAALTYVYNSFGNSGKEVTPQEVRALRGQKAVVNTPEDKNPLE